MNLSVQSLVWTNAGQTLELTVLAQNTLTGSSGTVQPFDFTVEVEGSTVIKHPLKFSSGVRPKEQLSQKYIINSTDGAKEALFLNLLKNQNKPVILYIENITINF